MYSIRHGVREHECLKLSVVSLAENNELRLSRFDIHVILQKAVAHRARARDILTLLFQPQVREMQVI